MTEELVRLGISGMGRMGNKVLGIARQEGSGIEVVAGFDVIEMHIDGMAMIDASTDELFRQTLEMSRTQVLLIFHADADKAVCQANIAADLGIAVVIGTTTFENSHFAELMGVTAQKVAVFHASNFGESVSVMFELIRVAACLLPKHFIDQLDRHHIRKLDGPSGTAEKGSEAACQARGLDKDEAVVYGQERRPKEPRSVNEIVSLWFRSGETVGEHETTLTGSGDVLTVKHVALNRDFFAEGAARAILFIEQQDSGFYGMPDLLGLPSPEEFLAFLRQRQ